MKILQKLPRHESNSGQICSICYHAVSNHEVMIDTEYEQDVKLDHCLVCNCRKCEW